MAPDGRLARSRSRSAGGLAAPDLVDVETVSRLRKRWLAGDMSGGRFASAIEDLEDLRLDRYPTLPLIRRAYEPRANVTAYDATCFAPAEGLDPPLVTSDSQLAIAPGHPLRDPAPGQAVKRIGVEPREVGETERVLGQAAWLVMATGSQSARRTGRVSRSRSRKEG